MAKINQQAIGRSEVYAEIRLDASVNGFNEDKDCAVVAVAAACGVSYAKAHATLKELGRKDKSSTRTAIIHKGVKALGKELKLVHAHSFISQYPAAHRVLKGVTSHHPDRFPDVWRNGKTYLLYTHAHVVAVVNGMNCDWSRGRALRIKTIYEVM